MRRWFYPAAALALLTALNFFNYVDRSVLAAVQPLIQSEFHRGDADLGWLTSLFFFCYMATAPSSACWPIAINASFWWPAAHCYGAAPLFSPPSLTPMDNCCSATRWWELARPASSPLRRPCWPIFFLSGCAGVCFQSFIWPFPPARPADI